MVTYTQRKEQKSLRDHAHDKTVEEINANASEDWPECVECGDWFPPKRQELGYETCLSCGSPKKIFTVVPVPKSNYTVATSAEQVRSPYSHKGEK